MAFNLQTKERSNNNNTIFDDVKYEFPILNTQLDHVNYIILKPGLIQIN